MVGTIKRWLGIDALEHENLILAKALKAHTERLNIIEQDARDTLSQVVDLQNSLTAETAKPKIVAKPMRMIWKNFRSAVEREPQEEQNG